MKFLLVNEVNHLQINTFLERNFNKMHDLPVKDRVMVDSNRTPSIVGRSSTSLTSVYNKQLGIKEFLIHKVKI